MRTEYLFQRVWGTSLQIAKGGGGGERGPEMLFENLDQHFIPLCTELWLLPLEYGTEGPKLASLRPKRTPTN